jgi:hypothetical protein
MLPTSPPQQGPAVNSAALHASPPQQRRAVHPAAIHALPTQQRRAVHPAGIQARQHQLTAAQNDKSYANEFVQTITRAMDILKNRCVMCWMQGKHDWDEHESDNCPKKTGTHYGDKEYVAFRKSAIRLPEHWCYPCLIHQESLNIHNNCIFSY